MRLLKKDDHTVWWVIDGKEFQANKLSYEGDFDNGNSYTLTAYIPDDYRLFNLRSHFWSRSCHASFMRQVLVKDFGSRELLFTIPLTNVVYVSPDWQAQVLLSNLDTDVKGRIQLEYISDDSAAHF